MNWINTLLIIASIVFIAVLVYLMYWNPSPKVFSPLLSIVFSGVALLLATFIFSLRGEKKETTFFDYIILDKSNNIPISPHALEFFAKNENLKEKYGSDWFDKVDIEEVVEELNQTSTGKRVLRLQQINSLAATEIDQANSITFKIPKGEQAITDFYIELLQYKLILDLHSIHWESIRSEEYFEEGFKYFSQTKHKAFKFSESENVFGEVRAQLSQLRFHQSAINLFKHENGRFLLPKGTKVLITKPKDENSTQRGKINLSKKNFFDIEFTIKKVGKGREVALPAGVELLIKKETANNFVTYSFMIDIIANFEKLTALNPKTEEYKKWVAWLFKQLDEIYSPLSN